VGIPISQHQGPARTAAPPLLPATLRLGAIHLTVSDPDRSIAFYEEEINDQDAGKQKSRGADSNR
jgi:catechol-2,3-dioxygenase